MADSWKPLGSLLLGLAGAWSAGCASIPPETPASVAGREPVLLQAPAVWGRVQRDGTTVIWSNSGTLLLTPTTLYFTYGSGSDAVSYAMMTDVSVRALRPLGFFGEPEPIEGLLVVETQRPLCDSGCVMRLLEGPGAKRAVEIIGAARARVDPFGRSDQDRRVWLSSGMRNARAWWQEQPAFLIRTAPERKQALEQRFCEHTDCRGGGRSAAVFGSALRDALADESLGGYRFRQLDGVTVNRRTELDTGALITALRAADGSVRRLLVSDLTAIELRERISADYRMSVAATFRSFVDYYDLNPPKDGAYFIETLVVEKTLDEWLALSREQFDALLGEAARHTAARVRAELAAAADSAPAAAAPALREPP